MSFGVVIFTRNHTRWSDLREMVLMECSLPATHCESWEEFAHFVETTPVAGCILDYELGRAHLATKAAQSEFRQLTKWASTHQDIPVLILTPEPELAADAHSMVFWRHYVEKDPDLLSQIIEPIKNRVRQTLENLTLVNLESALDTASTSAIVIARSLNATQEMAQYREVGPLDPMTSAVTTHSHVDVDDLREVIHTLRAVSFPIDPRIPRVAVIGHHPPLVSALNAQKDLRTLHIRGLGGMPLLRERFFPHLVVVVEHDPDITKEILLELHLTRGLLQPHVLLLTEIQDFASHFAALEISEMLDASLSPHEIVAYLREVVERKVREAPRVGIVDDDGQLAEFSKFIAGLGIEVQITSNPLSALEPIDEEFDVLVIKRNYRKLSGLDLCRRLHGTTGVVRTPIVMILQDARQDLRTEAFQHGADEVLTLPFGPAESRVRLQTLLANHSMRRRISRLDELTGANHWSALKSSLDEHLIWTRRDQQWTSLLILEIVGFDAMLRKHGIATCRTLLRHVSDHLTQNISPNGVFRSWRDRFMVIAEKPLLEDEVETRLNAIRSVTFRDHEGRGFYVKLRGGHLKIPPSSISAKACINALMRILERTSGRYDHILTAEIDPDAFPLAPSEGERESQRNNGWCSVVLTSHNE